MGTFRYSHPADEIGAQATVTVQAGAVAAGYEATFLTDFSDANLGRPTLATGTSLALQLAFPAPVSLAAMLFWHNLDNGLSIAIAGNTVASWAAPVFSTSVAVLPRRQDGRTIKLAKLLSQTFRYWLVTLPTNSVPPGLKLQCYSQARALDGLSGAGQYFPLGSTRPNYQFGIDLPTDAGFHWHYNFDIGAEVKSGDLKVSNTDLDKLRAWQQATGGRALTLFMPDADSAEVWLSRMALGPAPMNTSPGPFQSLLSPRSISPGCSLVTLTLEEVTAGMPEWS